MKNGIARHPESGDVVVRTEVVSGRSNHPDAFVHELFFSKHKFQHLSEDDLVNSNTSRAVGSVKSGALS